MARRSPCAAVNRLRKRLGRRRCSEVGNNVGDGPGIGTGSFSQRRSLGR